MRLPLIDVTGSPEQAGVAYGRSARALVRTNLETYRRRFAEQAGLDAAAVTAAGMAFRAATVTHFPRIAAMLDGVAAGAEAPPPEIFALNARTELLYGHPLPGDEGCTAIGVLGTHTATGHLILGQNWDWHPDQREAMILLRTTDERGLAVLTLTEAGMLAKVGLNSAGVGQCLTMLVSDRDGRTEPPGVPYHVLARATLEAQHLTGATRAACRSPRNASINLMLGHAGDPAHGDAAAGGELLDLELVPREVGLLHPVDGLVTHANHLEALPGVHDMQKDWGGSSLIRSARARRLLAPVVAGGKTTTDDLAEVFRDHAGFPHAICRHADRQDSRLEWSETLCSIVMDLDERRFGIAPGPPCGSDYSWYDVAG